jgi:hypothetical protein
METSAPSSVRDRTIEAAEPRWPAIVALLAVGSLYTALPEAVSVGPRWILPTLIAVLIVPTVISHRTGRHSLNQMLGFTINTIITVAMIVSLILLIAALPLKKETPAALLASAAELWGANVLVFALWYWRLDAGGPGARDLHGCHVRGDFLFPQLTLDADLRAQLGQTDWTPGFVDYLFVAFNTSTAFSPTDVAVLSRWAKVLSMVQSGISLTTIAVLVSRGINVL